MTVKERCLYFTRHGQTVWNVENKICGRTDIALTAYGQEQARALGKRIKEEKIAIDEIWYSPLIRARDTAIRIQEETGIPIRADARIIEQSFGRFESTPRDGAAFEKAKQDFLNRYDGGESMMQLCQRIYNLLDDVKEQSGTKTILLVAHNGISRAVESYFHDMTNEEYASFKVKNCALRKYSFERGCGEDM